MYILKTNISIEYNICMCSSTRIKILQIHICNHLHIHSLTQFNCQKTELQNA